MSDATQSRIYRSDGTRYAAAAPGPVRTDGVANSALNLGNKGDPVSATKYAAVPTLGKNAVSRIYRSDGLGKRVVDLVVDDSMREWIEADEALLAELARIKAKPEAMDAFKWGRLFGGAVVVALIDDGLDFDQPVNPRGIRRVLQLRTYDRHRVTWTTADIDQDPQSPNFGCPAVYSVQPVHGTPYRVHVSRMHKIDGLSLPDDERQRNNGWGDSAIQPVYQALLNYGLTMNSSASIVRDFVQTVLSINGLSEMVRQGNDDLITKRAELIDMTRSVANTVFLDAEGETYSKQASSVAGLADLWDRFAQHVCAATGIPATKLMGRAPQGLNATGEGDAKNWHDVVQAYRTDEVQPLVEWLIGLLDAQLDWRAADRPETMEWQWPALGQPTDAEWAEVKLKNAQTDQIYMDRGAVDPAYLYELRWGQGKYRPDITYDADAFEEWVAQDSSSDDQDGEGGSTSSPMDAQKEALNGAQITALQGIVQAVADGTLPPETAIQVINVGFTQVTEEQAKRMVDPADGFTPDQVNGPRAGFNPADNFKQANPNDG